MDDSDHNSAAAYWRLLRGNRVFSLILLGEVVSQAGGWFNYVATMELVKMLGGGRGFLIAAVIIVRSIPSALVFPLAGIVADRYNRVTILICAALVSAVTAECLTFVRQPDTLWLMYALLFLLFTFNSFYDPARKALTAQLVPRRQLPLAAVLDGIGWSVMAAVGSAVGGIACSRFGTQNSFRIDAGTYLVAALCSAFIWRAADKQTVDTTAANLAAEIGEPVADGSSPLQNGGSRQQHSSDRISRKRASRSALAHSASLGQRVSIEAAASTAAQVVAADPKSLAEGWRYIAAPQNRDLAAMCVMKACGALVWGVSDVLYPKFSSIPAMQIRDSATSLGVIYGAMGTGAIIGPLLFNAFTPATTPHLLRSVALGFATALGGYLAMVFAPNVAFLLPSVVLRSVGSSVIWVHSSLLIQLRADNSMQGRLFAFEYACYVLLETVSTLFGGFLFDDLGLGTKGVALVMTGVTTPVTAAWGYYAWRNWKQAPETGAAAEPLLAAEADSEAV